jgi:hypothetical protein
MARNQTSFSRDHPRPGPGRPRGRRDTRNLSPQEALWWLSRKRRPPWRTIRWLRVLALGGFPPGIPPRSILRRPRRRPARIIIRDLPYRPE